MFPTAIALDRYEVLRELSNNEAGGTYKALVRADNKNVALRVIKPSTATNPDLGIILQNGSRSCALSSPYIVHVLEAYESEGSVCLLMDYTEGSLLSAALGTDKMSDWDLADLARQLCSAIDHAASKNIFHQNLSPSNIIQEWDGTVKLMDYGVTVDPKRRAESNPASAKALRYLSPEQAAGRPIERRSNLFSLGAILYEMTTGQAPFSGDQPTVILDQIANETPRAPRLIKQSIHPGLSDLIMKAIAKLPDERFQTGAELLHALDHYRDHQTAAPKSPVSVAPLAPPKPLNHVSAPASSRYASPTPPSVAPRPPAPRTVPPTETRPLPPRPVAAVAPVAPMRPVQKVDKPISAPAQPVAAPPAPPKPALKPTPRSEFIIVGPRADVEVPAAKATPAPIPTVPTGSVAPAIVAPVPAPTSAPPVAVAAPAPVPPQTPTSVSAPVQPSTSAPVQAPPQTVVRPPQPAAQPKQVTARPQLPTRTQHAAPVSQRNSRTPLIAVTVGLLCLVALAGIGVYFLTHTETPVQQQNQAQPSAPVEQTAPVEEPQLAAQANVPEPPSANKKKKQKEVQPVVAPVPVLGNLYIQSSPEGATIEIDGQGSASTPRLYPNLPTGSRTVRISKPGYEPVTRTIQIDAGQTAQLNVTLTELRATVLIGSDPDGAAITINGDKTGKTTPATVSLLKGRYNIVFQKQGFLPSENTIDVVGGQSYKVSPRLAALGNADAIKDVGKLKKLFGGANQTAQMGKVQFRSVPKGAQVSVNGKIMKKPTPMELYFPAGHYEVLVSMPGYRSFQKTISVTEDTTQAVDAQLERDK